MSFAFASWDTDSVPDVYCRQNAAWIWTRFVFLLAAIFHSMRIVSLLFYLFYNAMYIICNTKYLAFAASRYRCWDGQYYGWMEF